MEPKKRGRPKKVVEGASIGKTEIPEPTVKIARKAEVHTGSDAVLKINLSMPDREPKDYVVRIKNVRGNLLGNKRNPDGFIEIIKTMIKARFPGVI